MKLHEFEAKKVLSLYGIAVPKGMAFTSLQRFTGYCSKVIASKGNVVVKVQCKTGGRGRAGGVVINSSVEQCISFYRHFYGKKFITQQSPRGCMVQAVYAEELLEFTAEHYCAVLFNRERCCYQLLLAVNGGTDIEHQHEVRSIFFDNTTDLSDFKIRNLCFEVGFDVASVNLIVSFVKKLIHVFLSTKALMVEVNPFTIKNGQIICLDAKISLDDNALDLNICQLGISLPKVSEVDNMLKKMRYVQLDGSIGCIVNGAGLAMAVMDSISGENMHAANFFDIGGSPVVENISKALSFLNAKVQVRVILINVFGGIVDCDIVANGVLDAVQGGSNFKPIILNLQGNHSEHALKLLASVKPVSVVGSFGKAKEVLKVLCN